MTHRPLPTAHYPPARRAEGNDSVHREPNDPYPPIDPYGSGMLDVGDGNHVYGEVCGNPDG